ncbi:MAG TPA: protein kinase [Gemmatimonadaceae bacterium]|nr:protein kinase [Gemmatimonadaceae bacterium]
MNESQFETWSDGHVSQTQPLTQWGPFQQLQLVGRGSFGEVYRAFDPTLQRHVALKLLLPRVSGGEEQAAAVLREARAMARIRHANVVPIYGVDRHQGRVGFWTDFVNGQTLTSILETHGAMSAREAALIGIEVCRAVGAVHGAGLVHRDIKAANIMREQGGRIVLMDFGLTHEHGVGDYPSGTPLYMAPELLDGHPATVASDIYAVGVLIFHLMTKQYPVSAATTNDLRAAHQAGTRRTLPDVRPDLPDRVVHVVETAGNPLPERRHASAGRMALALSDAIGLAPEVVDAPIPPRAVGRTWLIWVGVVIATAAVLLAITPLRTIVTTQLASTTSVGNAAQDEYSRAHDLVAHYYRPKALETAIPILEKVVAAEPQFAPAYADLARANVLQFVQQRDTKYIQPTRDAALRAITLAPDLASPHVTLSSLYTRTSQNELARHELDEALRSIASMRPRTAGWEIYTRDKAAPRKSSRRCRKPSAWRRTTGIWCNSSVSTT